MISSDNKRVGGARNQVGKCRTERGEEGKDCPRIRELSLYVIDWLSKVCESTDYSIMIMSVACLFVCRFSATRRYPGFFVASEHQNKEGQREFTEDVGNST